MVCCYLCDYVQAYNFKEQHKWVFIKRAYFFNKKIKILNRFFAIKNEQWPISDGYVFINAKSVDTGCRSNNGSSKEKNKAVLG